jgi:phosphatidylglycerol---prolipoprotein diacylglyceryl transferase
MLPEVLRIPALGVTVYTYGVLVAVGFAAGLYLTTRLAEREGIARSRIYDLVFWLLPAGLLGTKILLIARVLHDAVSGREQVSISRVVDGGGFYFGGFLTALVAGTVLIKIWGLPWFTTADTIAPSLALGNVFGRLGCFAAGCCWGGPTTSWVGVRFGETAHRISGVPSGTTLIPTQLIEAGANAVILGLLVYLWRRRMFQGQIILAYLMCYSIEPFLVEFLRADPRGRINESVDLTVPLCADIRGCGHAVLLATWPDWAF